MKHMKMSAKSAIPQGGTKLTTLICAMLLSMVAFSQDVITYRNGNEVKAKITEVTPTEVKYKKFDNLDGPAYTEIKANIFMIKYENGTKEVFVEQAPPKNVVEPTPSPIVDDYVAPKIVAKKVDDRPEIRHYGGPRLGITYVGPGAFADILEAEGKRNIYSQFGWQFEARMFTTDNGLSGLVEFVPLIGGLDMGKFIPSISVLMGIRTKEGIEFGVGPNLALYFSPTAGGWDFFDGPPLPTGSLGIVLAAGMSIKSGKINFPINLAFVPSIGKVTTVYDPITNQNVPYKYQTGAKVSLLIGFNNRTK